VLSLNTKPELKLQLQLGRDVKCSRDMRGEKRREKERGDLLGLGERGCKMVE
jgi:hypothetical protein